ncbi:MAG: MFS transporter [Aquamicrobium sp.]|nr:MFS transporter [Aquamicrobium sp.]
MQSPCEAGSDAAPQSVPETKGTFCPQARRRYVLIAAILASALGFIDGSVVSIALPAIRADLGASLVDAQWISNAYALTLSALILVGGAAGDRFGMRRAFVAGIGFFIATSLLCAFAPNAPFLIGVRALQGVGAALMVPGSLAIIAKAYPKAERGRAIGIWAAASALTTALGPVIGGVVLSAFDDSVWRAIFAVNLPLGGLAIFLLLAKVPDDTPTDKRKLDIGGAALATIALGSLAYGLTSGAGGVGPVAFIVVGLVVLAIFLWWEAKTDAPMMKLSLFSIAAFSGANAATFCLYFALSGILFFLPMLLIAGWGVSEAQTGFIFLPLSAAIALLSGFVGRLADRIGPRLPIAGGSLVVALAFAGLALLVGSGVRQFWTGVFPLMVLMALGMALVVSPLSSAVMTAVEDDDTGAASGINNAVSRIAGLVAVAMLGVVVAGRYAAVVGDMSGVPGFGEPGNLAADTEALRIAASDAAFAAIAWVTAALSLAAALIAWMTTPGIGSEVPAADAREAEI